MNGMTASIKMDSVVSKMMAEDDLEKRSELKRQYSELHYILMGKRYGAEAKIKCSKKWS